MNNSLDNIFADFMCSIEGNKELFSTISLLSRSVSEGHSCISLGKEQQLFKNLETSKIIGKPGDYKPLILEDDRLYLQKYWYYEHKLAENIKDFLSRKINKELTEDQKTLLEKLFDDEDQKNATQKSIANAFSIISGGPGTGKTTTIAKLLYIILFAEPELNIAVAAPTGKASSRIGEAMARSLGYIKELLNLVERKDLINEAVIQKISNLKGQTLHRLLSKNDFVDPLQVEKRKSTGFNYDIVIVDEASMIDLEIMSEFMDWCKPCARVVIIGDKDQLFSVESGSVMNELCGSEVLTNNISVLKKNWRSKEQPAIAELSKIVNTNTSFNELLKLFSEHKDGISYSNVDTVVGVRDLIKQTVLDVYSRVLNAENIEQALMYYDSFKILCAIKKGPLGVYKINEMVEDILSKAGIINTYSGDWYDGRPIIITKNDYGYGLFNGDTGLIYKGRAYFKNEADGTLRSFVPSLLPEHETAYAITIHKSQGSEFNKVFVILPSEDSPVLSKQLIYTAITRAKKQLHIISSNNILKLSCSRSITRMSGLSRKLGGKFN